MQLGYIPSRQESTLLKQDIQMEKEDFEKINSPVIISKKEKKNSESWQVSTIDDVKKIGLHLEALSQWMYKQK